jgi:PHD/YefM family antitoxin component YafN of YafNO toxin-antitoxin module
MIADEIRHSSEVRDHWSQTLDEVESGTAVTVTRRDHDPVTIVSRQHYIELLRRVQELEELAEVYELLSDPEVREGVSRAEAEIERGDGISFEEAFGEEL